MEDEYEKTVSVYSKSNFNSYKLIICENGNHRVVDLSTFEKNEITFGRAPSNDIVIKSNLISGHHGVIEFDNGLKIKDNNSTNGLFINGEKETVKALSDGDEIKIDNPEVSLKNAVYISVVYNDKEVEKCPHCKEQIGIDKKEEKEEKKEIIKEEKVYCPKCGNILPNGKDSKCDVCAKKEELNNVKPVTNSKNNNKFLGLIIAGCVGGFFLLVVLAVVSVLLLRGSSAVPKVDVTMNSYYGSVSEILDEFGLDFDSVTKGGNCFTGQVNGSFQTKKYGILHTEYSYCKSNKTLTLRVYNLDTDQKTRDPMPGEVPEFDVLGKKKSSSKI